jgi:hypothetical protein
MHRLITFFIGLCVLPLIFGVASLEETSSEHTAKLQEQQDHIERLERRLAQLEPLRSETAKPTPKIARARKLTILDPEWQPAAFIPPASVTAAAPPELDPDQDPAPVCSTYGDGDNGKFIYECVEVAWVI